MVNDNTAKELKKLITLYNGLDVNDKRNELSNLINKINAIINEILKLEESENLFKVKNYDSNNQKTMKEEELLSFIYEDIYSLKNNLLLLLTIIVNDKNNI